MASPREGHAIAQAPADRVIVPTELAALAAGVPEATIRKWASRGKLTRYGSPRRAEYDLDELYQLLTNGARRRSARTPDRPVGWPAAY
jgi:hypothetical protein